MRDPNKAWVRWVPSIQEMPDPSHRVKQVGMVRFIRPDGIDPRVQPEDNGTHLSRGRPSNVSGMPESSCGLRQPGFTDYGPIEGITCLDCAAMLAAQLLKESGIEG